MFEVCSARVIAHLYDFIYNIAVLQASDIFNSIQYMYWVKLYSKKHKLHNAMLKRGLAIFTWHH